MGVMEEEIINDDDDVDDAEVKDLMMIASHIHR